MAASIDFMYGHGGNNLPVKLSVVALGGLGAVVLMIGATLGEFRHLTLSARTFRILLTRLLILLFMGACHVAATFYILKYDRSSSRALIISSCQLGFGIIITLLLVLVPPVDLFSKPSQPIFSKTFTANFPRMIADDRFLSFFSRCTFCHCIDAASQLQ
ncbi:hypothetical protein G6F68_012807 [Rhizopus microsporus]|nr:hypothetical protein G6F68_012807 [Rhizopus microsporus]